MSESEKPSAYPSVSKGPLSASHDKYARPLRPKGPKSGDMQTKTIVFGVVFFILFTIAFAFLMGFGRYFKD